MELTTGILVALCFCCDQRPPSADHISRLREAHERERAYAIRAVSPSRSSLPLSSLQDEAVPIGTLRTPLSEADRMELKAVLRRFVRERAGELVDIAQRAVMLQHWGEHRRGDEPVKLRDRVLEWVLAGLSLLSIAGQLW